MEGSGSAASNVAQAIAVAGDWSCAPEARRAALAYLESFKSGDIHVLASTSILLIRKDWSSEIRLHGFKTLQHLVRFRWDEFTVTERKDFANTTISLIFEMVNSHEEWALKSQMAALVVEVLKREVLTLWHELLPSIVSLSNRGPIEAELVAMMLRWLPEDITVHNEDLEGDRRRILLRGLTDSLPEILPLLYTFLEKHFSAALSEFGRQQFDKAKEHAATVTAALNAIIAYADWAPVPDLAKYGLIHGCGFLLSSLEFRLHACELFKLICQRKRPVDAGSEFDSAMNTIFQILMDKSRDFLNRSCSSTVGIDESEFEFMECVCESMVALGSSHIQCLVGSGDMTSQFLHQMLGYFQHYKFALHFQSLAFWQVIMRESVSKARAAAQIAGDISAVSSLGSSLSKAEKEKKGVSVFISEDMFAAILDVSFQRMLKRNTTSGTSDLAEALELWNDEFDGKNDFGQYRCRLLELIKHVAFQKPLVAAARICQRIEAIIKSSFHAPVSAQELALMESMQLGLEAVVGAVFDGSIESVGDASQIKLQPQAILEGLLQQLLSLKWTEPALAVVLGRYLDAIGPYLKYNPDAIAGVISKLFELLTSLPLALKEPSSSARHARLQICTSFIRIAGAADKCLLPHMKGIADTMAYLEREGRLLRGEHNLLGEAFLVMASSSGIQQQQEVVAWLLEPLSKQWTQLEWQNIYLSDPLGLSRMCSDTQFMWSIFHTVTFFEKALKRSGVKKANLTLQSSLPASDIRTCPHPMSSHLAWILPPLLRLLRSIHSLWSQPVDQALTVELRAAKSMNRTEQSCLLGEGNLKLPKGQMTVADGSQINMNREGESNENDIRNWLKGVRDSGYNVIGLSTTIGDVFFRCLDSSSVALALMENIQSMEYRHIRQLVHSVIIPLVKHCPADLWEAWLENLLYPLFLHCQQALSCSWSSLLHDTRARVPDTFGNLVGLELKVEVMEEKLLRDLTREICSLLSVLASPALNRGLPSLEQLGHANHMDTPLKDLDAFASNSMIGFLLRHKGPSVPALRISLQVFSWTDGEAVAKVISFCGAVILLAISTNNVELREFVARDMFCAIIQGLDLESNAIISADLVGLSREIYVYLADKDPVPRQVLLSLPCIRSEDLLAFEDALTKTTSPREQKQHMKFLLQLATGNKLKALAAQKSTNVITNVTVRSRSSAASHGPNIEEDDSIGLAAIT